MYFTIVFFFLLQGGVWRGRELFSKGCQRLSPEEANVVGASPSEAGLDIWFLGGGAFGSGVIKDNLVIYLYSLGLL